MCKAEREVKWKTQVSSIMKREIKGIYRLRAYWEANLPQDIGLTKYSTKITPLLEYTALICVGLPQYLEDELQIVPEKYLQSWPKILGRFANFITNCSPAPPPPCNVDTMLCLSTVQMIPVALNIVWGEGGFIKIAKTA